MCTVFSAAEDGSLEAGMSVFGPCGNSQASSVLSNISWTNFFNIDQLTDFAACVSQILQTGDTFTHGWYFQPSL